MARILSETVLDKAAKELDRALFVAAFNNQSVHGQLLPSACCIPVIRRAMESLIREAAEVIAHAGDCAQEGGCTHGFGPDPDEARDAVLHWAGLEPKSEREREG